MSKKRILIVGGVAGGASCAARARRLSEEAEIIIFDRGAFVSFANCGLPYYVGDVIADEKKLLVANTDLFRERFNIEVRLLSEVLAINPQNQTITVKNLTTQEEYCEKYDDLVLAPGAAPLRPPIPGIDSPGIFSLRTIPDSRKIRQWIADHNVKNAVIVGGGFIGLEMAENLINRGIHVTLIEKSAQVMPSFDYEMITPVHDRLQSHGVQLCLNNGVTKFESTPDNSLLVSTENGLQYPAEMVILAIGVKPETTLAKQAGLELGSKGGIKVDQYMKTSQEHIWAVGDAVEVQDYVTQEWINITLAGPANREGRIAADNICGRSSIFRGSQGTAVCGIFGLTVASTGASEKNIKQNNLDYQKIYLHPGHHVGYFPGAKKMALKLLFCPETARILGAQGVGEEGVEKRLDVISMAIQCGATIYDLEEAELCYAPQFGAAKDPVNFAGMIAANALRGDCPIAHWSAINLEQIFLVDVREKGEFDRGNVQGAINIPLSQLRDRLADFPADRPIYIYCQVGQRGYYATRVLRLNGYQAFNLTGGYQTYLTL